MPARHASRTGRLVVPALLACWTAALLATPAPAGATPPRSSAGPSCGRSGSPLDRQAPPGVRLCAPLGRGLRPSHSPAAQDAGPCAPSPAPVDRCEAWASTYDGPAHGPDGAGEGLLSAKVEATSPDGSLVFVAATSDGASGTAIDADVAVVAYRVADGSVAWTSRYAGPAALPLIAPLALGVSPSGDAVFVTGTAYDSGATHTGMVTAGFDAATGERRWVATHGLGVSYAADLAVAGPSGMVVVTGEDTYTKSDNSPGSRSITIAYDPVTGARRWARPYEERDGRRTGGWRVAASPTTGRVFVAAGGLDEGGMTTDLLLLVYSSTGSRIAVSHQAVTGFPPAGLEVSADGSRVYLEEADLVEGLNHAHTVAYSGRGRRLWDAQFKVCGTFKCSTRPWYYDPIGVSPDGSRVFVTGLSVRTTVVTEFSTVSYDARTGHQQWVATYQGNVFDCVCGPVVGADPGGARVYVTGLLYASLLANSGDAVTLAYDAATGDQVWSATHVVPGGSSWTDAMAVPPGGALVLVAGGQEDVNGNADALSMAYDTTG